MSSLDDLAEAMNNRQITDKDGQIADDTASENTAPLETNTEDEGATAEKSAGSKESTPVDEKESENEPEMVETASDESGKRYVPEERFKEVYAKWKKAERKEETKQVEKPSGKPVTAPLTKTDALEIEILRSTLPQFNPENPEYSREIDELGYSLYEGSKDSLGNYSLTRIQAGKKALEMAKKITSKVAEIKTEARTVKAQQSDRGITNRVLNREQQQVDPNKMSLEEKEEWLKANNAW